jgi:hypothetical protein
MLNRMTIVATALIAPHIHQIHDCTLGIIKAIIITMGKTVENTLLDIHGVSSENRGDTL